EATHRLLGHFDVRAELRVVDPLPARQRDRVEEATIAAEISRCGLGLDLLAEVDLAIGPEDLDGLVVAPIDAGQHAQAERAIPVDVARLEDGERVEMLEDHPAREQARTPAAELARARSGEHEANGAAAA